MAAVEIMLLAVTHLEGTTDPDGDAVSHQRVDVATPERQAELDEVVAGLARFAPTKVAVEIPRSDQERLHGAYVSRRSGGAPLPKGEVGQIGMRLAAYLDHRTLYAVDVPDRFYEPAIEELLAEPAHRERWDRALAMAESHAEAEDLVMQTSTIGEALRVINDPEALRRSAAVYHDQLAAIADPATGRYPGPDMVANFHRRNLRIAANLREIAESGDRVTAIIGMGHVPFLADILGATSDISVVAAGPCLGS